jgi:hypothetical protein
MTYLPSIPQAPDLLSVSQGQLLANFTQLNAIFSQNHIPLNQSVNSGRHTYIQMVPQTNPSAIPGIGNLYVINDSGVTNDGLLHFKSGLGTNNQVAYAKSGTIAVGSNSSALIPNLVGNVGGSIYWAQQPSGGPASFYAAAFYQNSGATPSFLPLLTPIIAYPALTISWSAGSPPQLQFRTGPAATTFYYTAFYTLAQ